MHPIQTVKNVTKKVVKFVVALPIAIKIFTILMLSTVIITGIDFVVELFTAENNPEELYSSLEVKDMSELVEIKKSEDGSGYYLDFVSDFDDKLNEIVKKFNKEEGFHQMPSKDFLKKIIKAEVITQFPNLGGTIPEGSSGFQGAIDIRRITPDREIGNINDNPGRGETSTVEQPEEVFDTVPENTQNEEIVKTWKQGQKLNVKSTAVVYEQQASTLKPGTDTGYWEKKLLENDLNQYVTISKGTEVTYTGTYKTSTNALSKEMVVYVEIETPNNEKVFVRSENLEIKENVEDVLKTSKIENNFVTSRATQNIQKQAGKEGENYTIAIAAGHNNTNNTGASSGSLIEEELTIKTAEKVEELLKEYSNIKVVQTGSTAENPGGINKEDRKELARKANPDLCIQIHYDAGGGSGVQAIYKEGDGVSQQLAEFLANAMAISMDLPNNGAGADINRCAVGSLGIIENSVTSGFPSVVTEGGFIDGEPDASLLKDNGTDLCAQGIVNGILDYLKADHTGYVATLTEEQRVQESIASKVYNLKYVEPQEMENYIENGNLEALRVFTLDDNKNLITVTWSRNADGQIELKKNSAMNFRTMLSKYVMPYEYLLYYYIDTNETSFPDQLADEVLKSEIVIAVQDNVTTTQTVTTTKEKQVSSNGKHDYSDKVVNQIDTITEVCTPAIEITYANTWCVKYYKQNSYSKSALGWKDGEQEEKLDIKGKVTVTNPSLEVSSSTSYTQYGEKQTGQDVDTDHNIIEYTYVKYRKDEIATKTMDIKYDTGDAKVQGNENKFINLYQSNKMNRLVRTPYLFKILENNERTVNLLDLTKYLIYKATSKSYGVIEFDFSEFDLGKFISIYGEFGDWDGTGTKEDFIRAVAPYAVIDMEQHNIYASVTIAQAIIESGWGKDNIAIQYKNFFGMKAGRASANEFWSGESVALNASEGGVSRFRVYDSLKNSIYDHGRNFHVTSTYSEHGVLDCIPQNLGPKEQLRRIAISGYAVYRNGSISRPDGVRTYDVYLYEEFIKKYNLEQYDTMSSSDFISLGNSQVVEIAKSKIGSPYVFGAKGPWSFDCSGFVYWCYQQTGVNVPGTTDTYKPYKGSDKEISWDQAQPGDILIVFDYERGTSSGHAGIYLGNDSYIHSPRPGKTVTIVETGAKSTFKHVFRFN